jgi:hypothetical protein
VRSVSICTFVPVKQVNWVPLKGESLAGPFSKKSVCGCGEGRCVELFSKKIVCARPPGGEGRSVVCVCVCVWKSES